MTKKELLLRILKIIIIYSYLSSLCCFYLIVFMIGFEGELFTVTQFYLILYGVPLSASICFGFIAKKYAVIYFGSSCFFHFLLLCFICGRNFFFNNIMLLKTQDKKGSDFLAIEVKNDNLLILNSFNLFYLFLERTEVFL